LALLGFDKKKMLDGNYRYLSVVSGAYISVYLELFFDESSWRHFFLSVHIYLFSDSVESSQLEEMVSVTSLYRDKLTRIKESMLRISERSANLR
jgi:hypothetical protein